MKDEFSLTFQKIQKEFSEVFKELFKGGKATLTLTNPDDLLTTGIDITASPPGKKLSNISLLSGGEKTLTAHQFAIRYFKCSYRSVLLVR